MAKPAVYLGTFIHCTSLEEMQILHDAAVFVDEEGKIVAIEKDIKDIDAALSYCSKLDWEVDEVIARACGKDQFFFPGFIDTHIHASQYPNAGIFGKTTLLDWLNTYTFPLESSLSSLPKARQVYSRCIARTLSHGTTTAAYYATISVASTNLLADLCAAAGQRAFIGRVCMDTLSPDYYRDASPASAVEDTLSTINHIKALDPNYTIVSPIITPRFAPSCSSAMLKSLGTLAKTHSLPIQTHISENQAEIALVADLFPGHQHYTDVYTKHGLLGPKTILAHAIHLSLAERDVLSQSRTKISHCPISNSSITSGEARVRWLLDGGVDVGLGTDMSGGFSPSILETARQALLVSRHVAMKPSESSSSETSPSDTAPANQAKDPPTDPSHAKLSIQEVLYLATVGGAKVVGLQDKIGAFEIGMEWDAQFVSLQEVAEDGHLTDDEGKVDVFGWESWEEKVAKWLFCGDDRNTLAVWVRGRLVHER